MKGSKTMLLIANAQLTGFAHASKGYNVVDLVESMALTFDEYGALRPELTLKACDIDELDKHFKLK